MCICVKRIDSSGVSGGLRCYRLTVNMRLMMGLEGCCDLKKDVVTLKQRRAQIDQVQFGCHYGNCGDQGL